MLKDCVASQVDVCKKISLIVFSNATESKTKHLGHVSRSRNIQQLLLNVIFTC